MRVDKVIMRAAMSTITAIAILLVAMVLMLSFLSPWTMMHITYDLGMERASIRNARRAYNMSGDVYYAAFGMNVAIVSGRDEMVIDCGKIFIADDKFTLYCDEKTAELFTDGTSYKQYVYAQVSLAQYRQNDKEGALATAFSSLDDKFEKNNAVVAVLITALADEDSDTVDKIKLKMNEMQPLIPQADGAYFMEIFALAQNG